MLDAAPGTPEFDELEVLSLLVEAYENAKFCVEQPDPIVSETWQIPAEPMIREYSLVANH